MLCYRDRTFCKFNDCQHFGICDRAFTEHHQEKSKAFGLPVSFLVNKPYCFEKHKEKSRVNVNNPSQSP